MNLPDAGGSKIRNFAQGEFADVRIYKRALGEEEIRIVYAAGSARLKK